MNKYLILLITLLSSFIVSNAQNITTYTITKQDTLILKNGDNVIGKLAQTPNNIFLINVGDNLYQIYQSNEVASCKSRVIEKHKRNFKYKTKGYRGYAEVGYSYGFNYKYSAATIRTTHGYQCDQNFFIGGGIGLDIDTDNYVDGTVLIPLYGAMRIQCNHRTVTPFIDLKMGYTFAISDIDYRSVAFMVNPSVGISIAVADNIGFNISVGYNYHDFSITNDNYHWHDSLKSHSISFNVGLEF